MACTRNRNIPRKSAQYSSKGSSVLYGFSQLLASMAPYRYMEVLAQMKVLGLLVVVMILERQTHLLLGLYQH